jgi:hypothetical protein
MTGLVGRRPGKRLDAALTTVAQAVNLTGAQIKSGALSAVLAARRRGATPAIADVMVGVRHELAKAGQMLSERDIERMVRRGA